MIRNLLFVILSIIFVSAHPVSELSNCEDMTVTVDIRTSRNSTSTITLRVKDAVGPFHYVFFRENGELLTNDFKSGTVRLDEKGRFYYAVVAADGCRVKSEFKIE